MRVTKHNYTFNVSGDYSETWYKVCINDGTWEQDTFHILDYYFCVADRFAKTLKVRVFQDFLHQNLPNSWDKGE